MLLTCVDSMIEVRLLSFPGNGRLLFVSCALMHDRGDHSNRLRKTHLTDIQRCAEQLPGLLLVGDGTAARWPTGTLPAISFAAQTVSTYLAVKANGVVRKSSVGTKPINGPRGENIPRKFTWWRKEARTPVSGTFMAITAGHAAPTPKGRTWTVSQR